MKTYLGHSDLLQRRWIVQAATIDDATGKVLVHCKEEIQEMMKEVGGDLDLDLKFSRLDSAVVEI